MDNPQDNKTNGRKSSPGPLIDIGSSSESLPVATISPNAVRNRIGATQNPTQHRNGSGNISAIINSAIATSRSSSAVPGSVLRSSVISPSHSTSGKINSPPSNVVERHLVRRTYEEQSHTTRHVAVGSRLAADTSPSGSTAGDLAPDNFDSLSLQLSPHLNRRAAATVPSTPARLSSSHQPSHQQQNYDDLLSLQDVKSDELSDSALQLQAELKRTLESSNSTFTSLVDLSAPVTKWKRAMSLPQNDFARAMCHRAVAKSLAQNIRSALRTSPSVIKESLAPGELQPPVYEQVSQEQQPPNQPQQRRIKDTIPSPKMSPTSEAPDNNNSNNNNNVDDIWVLRETYVEKLEDADRQWKAQQIVEEQHERRLQSETARRMVEYVKTRQDAGSSGIDELGFAAAVTTTTTRRSSSDSTNSGDNVNKNSKNYASNNNNNMEPSSSRPHVERATGSVSATSYSRLRGEASGHRQAHQHPQHHQQQHPRRNYQGQFSGEDGGSDYSDRDDEPEAQPSLLRPFSNFLSGRKGAYSKVPTLNEPHHQPGPRREYSSSSQQSSSYRAESAAQQVDRRRASNERQASGELSESAEYLQGEEAPPPVRRNPEDFDTDEETDKLLEKGYQGQRQLQLPELAEHALSDSKYSKPKVSMKEVRLADPDHPSVLLEGVLFRCRYLGSTQLVSDSQPSKAVRMMQAQEAVGRIKAPFGEAQPSTDVDLFISFEKVMVLSTNLQDIIMDHALKTISYVADLDDVVVLMARRRQLPEANPAGLSSSAARGPQLRMLCHVFECEDAHHISDAIGEAFHLAYMSFLRANGIEDPSALREVDMGEENIGPQDIFNDDLPRFVDKNHQRDVVVSKTRGEALGIVVVESGWGSVIPTVVVANMLPTGPASRSGQLNIGDQLLSINGISLVGLPMTSCQNYIKAAKNQTAVRITLIRCPPVTEVLIKRPDIKYQLGFSVHNGIICSLLRGGIAERGGVRVGHRIIEINGESVVAVTHDRIVNLLSSSVGEIRMKTMPMSIFRLLTGQDAPNYI